MKNRREFLKTGSLLGTSALLGLGTCLPELIPGTALGRDGKPAPSQRITMGVIGCGSHAGWNINLMLRNKEQQIIALCDVDQEHLARKKSMVDQYYGKENGREYSVDTIHDFRELLRQKDIDAVDIVTQDQWHVLMAVTAMKAGKDVICEKPTLTIEQGQILVETQKKTGRVFLTASQNRTVDTNQFLINVVRNGLIGKLKHVKVLLPYREKSREKRSFLPCPIPKTLDFDMWSGPSEILPYIPAISHVSWRHNLVYSGGVLPDWGAHYVNLATWAIDSDTTPALRYWGSPTSPSPFMRWHYPGADEPWNTTNGFDYNAEFANGVTVRIFSDKTPGIKFEGEDGWILAKGPSLYQSVLTASDPKILTWRPGPKDIDVGRELRHCMVSRTNPDGLPGVQGGEHVHFTHCIKTGQKPYYTAEMGACTDIIAHAGQISMMEFDGGLVEWDHNKRCFIGENAQKANASIFMRRQQRQPWTFEQVDSWLG
ncbi:MAG: Gfo/Idh/MocA family oxidoreductase [Thermoguttaceae bacterium]|nr:Gfo/Idh/MocA family oxidoreductase [Thermoguttaceae bacterium]